MSTFIGGLVKKIRNGLFLASRRSYGEQYIEPFVGKKYGLNDPTSNDNDGTDQNGKRYEIKACKVLKVTGNSKKLKTIIERILFENNNIETKRLVLFSESKTAEYLANVQNVKRDHTAEYALPAPQKVGRTVENILFVDTHAMILSSMVAITTNYHKFWHDKKTDVSSVAHRMPLNSGHHERDRIVHLRSFGGGGAL